MKATAVFTGKPNTVHLSNVTKPTLDQIPNGREVLIKVLRVGGDVADKETDAVEFKMSSAPSSPISFPGMFVEIRHGIQVDPSGLSGAACYSGSTPRSD